MPQLRKDPVTGRWVILHSDRAREVEELILKPSPEQGEQSCVYCEGRESETRPEIFALRREGTSPNGPGWSTRVVPHPIAALHVEGSMGREGLGMFDRMNGIGAHEIIVETPEHRLDVADMEIEALSGVLRTFRERIEDLRKDFRLKSTLIFKNQEKKKPSRIHHSYSQLLALPMIPRGLEAEYHRSLSYFEYKQRCVFCDMIADELRMGERIVFQNDSFLAFAPFASSHPFELCLIPKHHEADFSMMEEEAARLDCAEAIKITLQMLKLALLDPSYSFILHTMPNPTSKPVHWQNIENHYHWHMEIVPRVRNETGFERGTGFHLNPVSPERAACFLRDRTSRCVED